MRKMRVCGAVWLASAMLLCVSTQAWAQAPEEAPKKEEAFEAAEKVKEAADAAKKKAEGDKKDAKKDGEKKDGDETPEGKEAAEDPPPKGPDAVEPPPEGEPNAETPPVDQDPPGDEEPPGEEPEEPVEEEPVEEPLDEEEPEDEIAPVEVIGESTRDLIEVPGSAAVIGEQQLRDQAPMDTAEVLRQIPGVHAVDEEGMGLRLNIGVRGLDPERSRTVLVLEDGVPIASAPYSNPGMYYAPMIDRVSRIEVIKGSGTVLHGPQTVGGVINFITAAPPEDFEFKAKAQGGTFGFLSGQLSVGDTLGDVAYLVNVTHKRFTGARALELNATDVMAKLNVRLSPRARLGGKFTFYDEFSRATYLGLTTAQFETDPTSNFAIYDRFPVRRFGVSVNHDYDLSDTALLQTTVYAHQLTRDWQRQDFDRCINDDTCDTREYERIVDGLGREVSDPAMAPRDGSAVYFRNSTGNRNRQFFVAGAETRLTLEYEIGQIADAELLAGTRVHTEEFLNQRIDGTHGGSPTGDIREDERMFGQAFAAYALNRLFMFDRKLRVSPGLRFELFNGQRKIYRQRVEGVPTDLNPPVDESTLTTAIIPGLGASYDVTRDVTLFGGVHRGFSPPRTQDAIDREGNALDLEPEYSLNYELGARISLARDKCKPGEETCPEREYLYAEAAGFYLDFSQQIIEPTEASGAVSGGLVNAGETTHLGAEIGVTFDPLKLVGWDISAPLTVNYTFTRATFGDGWAEGLRGNVLPYAPAHMGTVQAGLAHPVGLSAQVTAQFLGEQFADPENTIEATPDGTRGRIDGRTLLHLRLAYDYEPWGLGVFFVGKNLMDQRFIASRRPRGIQPAGFRQLMGGLEWTF